MITVPEKVRVTRARLSELTTVKPKDSCHWYQPIAHSVLINILLKEIENRSWGVSNMNISLSKDTTGMAASLNLYIPSVKAPEGQSFSIGILTANDLTRRLRMVVGTNVFVCNNGMATGELIMIKKHTINLDLEAEVRSSLDVYLEKVKLIDDMVKRYTDRLLTEVESNQILMDAGRQEMLPWSRIGEVDKEFHNPTYPEHAEKNSWNLYNAYTSVVKKCPPLSQMTLMNKFRGLLPIQST